MNENKKKIWKIVLIVIAALVVAGLVGGYLLLNTTLNKIQREEPTLETISEAQIEEILKETDPVEEEIVGVVLEEHEIELATAPAEVIEKEDTVVNILLIGQDRRSDHGRARSDAMILCTINKEEKTLVMTSILRDIYINLPEYNGKKYGGNRLNVSYAIGGMEMLDQALLENFGVEVDHNIEVDFSGFEKVIDAVGGVNVTLTGNEAYIVGGGARKGENLLNGKQALEYSRIRSLDNDFGRTERQRKVISALVDQAKSLSLTELLDVANTVFPMLTTDIANAEIITYITEFFPILTELQITTQSVPVEGEYYFANIAGMSVLALDFDKVNQRLAETLGS